MFEKGSSQVWSDEVYTITDGTGNKYNIMNSTNEELKTKFRASDLLKTKHKPHQRAKKRPKKPAGPVRRVRTIQYCYSPPPSLSRLIGPGARRAITDLGFNKPPGPNRGGLDFLEIKILIFFSFLFF
jgi:hypothetical protein